MLNFEWVDDRIGRFLSLQVGQEGALKRIFVKLVTAAILSSYCSYAVVVDYFRGNFVYFVYPKTLLWSIHIFPTQTYYRQANVINVIS